jgi:hypothetical protein
MGALAAVAAVAILPPFLTSIIVIVVLPPRPSPSGAVASSVRRARRAVQVAVRVAAEHVGPSRYGGSRRRQGG